MNYSAVIVAAGRSTRFALDIPKILYEFPDGRKVIDLTVRVFLDDEDCRQIIIVTNEAVKEYLEERYDDERIIICRGGESRQDSVYNGLKHVSEEYVLVHDGARCFLEREDLENLKKEISEEQGALLVKSETDTVKIAEDGYVVRTIDRDRVKRAQTPQGFSSKELKNCYEKALADGFVGTDDCSLVERYGTVRIKCVESAGANIKITTAKDVEGGIR